MALVLADRVLETTTSTGSGTITLAGAKPGYQSFSVVGDGNTTYYTIAGSTEWEVGIGTYTASGTTLSRDTVLSSSDSGNKVTFSAGTKDVFVDYPAGRAVYGDASGAVVVSNLNATSASITTVTGTTAGFSSASITTLSGTTATYTSANITTLTGTTAGFSSANITTVTGTAATFTTSSDSVGNLRNIPSAGAAKTSEYTLTISDIGEFVTIGTSGKVLVPNNTFATGNAISVYNDTTGSVSINISTTTGYVVGTNTNRTGVTLATRGIANILFINPSYCILSGNLT